MDKTRDAALEVLATWCNEKGIGQDEYRRRCKEYDKHTSHDELVAALRKIDAFWTIRITQLGALSDEAMEVRNIGRAALAKATAQ